MTVVTYKSGVMACDSCWSDDGLVVSLANKIVKLTSGGLLGEAGDCDTRALIELLDKVKKPAQLPGRKLIAELAIDYHGLLVLPDGSVWEVASDLAEKDYAIYRVVRPFHAVGCGRKVAIGAMAAGASAPAAVSIACQWDTQCRGPVHQVTLPSRVSRRRPEK